MKSNKLKKISIILCVIMIILTFSACNDVSKTNEADVNMVEEQDAEQSEFLYPMKVNKKIKYWVGLNVSTAQKSTSLSETPFGKEYEEKTGVEIEYLHPSAGQEQEQFNLLVASGDYPDIVEYSLIDNYPGGPEKAMNDGFIIDLTKYMPKYAPNLMNYYKENTECEKMAKTDSGKFYSFPFIRSEDELMVFFGPVVRNDWLKDLNLEIPETMQDWYVMLKKFKDEKGATAPLTYQRANINVSHSFIGAYGIIKDFYKDDDGNVKYGPIATEYKEYLKEYHKWYKEGLLDPDIETVDGKQVNAKITSGDSGASLGYQASNLGLWLKAKENDDTFDLIGVKNPVLKKGDKPMFGQKDLQLPGTAAFITTGCKDVETAMRLLDYGYSDEGHMLLNFGIKGESYELKNGEPVYTDLILNNPEVAPAVSLAQYARASYSGPMIQDVRYIRQYAYTFEQQKSANQNWRYSDIDKYCMPKVTPTIEESHELANIMNEIKTYVDEMYVKFVFGQEDIDQKFDDYINNINNMGIDRAIQIKSEALERYNNR